MKNSEIVQNRDRRIFFFAERANSIHDERIFFPSWRSFSTFLFLARGFHVSSIDVITIFNNISKVIYAYFAKSSWSFSSVMM